MYELFAYYLQRGLVDVAFLGGAQIDRFGNLNTTVIGDYEHPKVRLPGSGGACEIAIHARRILVIMRQARRSFVERIDFRTSPGHSGDPAHDAARGWTGAGPRRRHGPRHVRVRRGDGRDDAAHAASRRHAGGRRANMGWEPRVADDARRDAAAHRRGVAADPRGARPAAGSTRDEPDPRGWSRRLVRAAPLAGVAVARVRDDAPRVVFAPSLGGVDGAGRDCVGCALSRAAFLDDARRSRCEPSACGAEALRRCGRGRAEASRWVRVAARG